MNMQSIPNKFRAAGYNLFCCSGCMVGSHSTKREFFFSGLA